MMTKEISMTSAIVALLLGLDSILTLKKKIIYIYIKWTTLFCFYC